MSIAAPTFNNSSSATSTAQTLQTTVVGVFPTTGVFIVGNAASGTTTAPSVSFSSTGLSNLGTFTSLTLKHPSQNSAICLAVVPWTANPGTSGSITIDWGQSTNRRSGFVAYTTGVDLVTPVRAINTGTGSNTAASGTLVTLPNTPYGNSLIVAIVNSRGLGAGNVITPGTLFTEITEIDSGGTQGAHLQGQYDLLGAGAACDWSTMGSVANVAAAFELVDATGPPAVTSSPIIIM